MGKSNFSLTGTDFVFLFCLWIGLATRFFTLEDFTYTSSVQWLVFSGVSLFGLVQRFIFRKSLGTWLLKLSSRAHPNDKKKAAFKRKIVAFSALLVALSLSAVNVIGIRELKAFRALELTDVPSSNLNSDDDASDSDPALTVFFQLELPFREFIKAIPSIPYIPGPPKRYLSRIVATSADYPLDFTWTGPTTLKDFESLSHTSHCLSRFASCLQLRRELFERILEPYLGVSSIREVHWFRSENNLQGLRVRGFWKEKKSNYIAYFPIFPNGVIQGMWVETAVKSLLQEAEQRLIGLILGANQKTSMQEAKLFVEEEISTLGFKSPEIKQLLTAYFMLISAVSVNPRNFDSFYHLGGVSRLLLQNAQNGIHPEYAPSFKRTLQATAKYAADIDPKDPRTEELASFVRVAQ